MAQQGLTFGRLEPCDGKLSSAVLRGLGAGNSPRLPGNLDNLAPAKCCDVLDKRFPPDFYVIRLALNLGTHYFDFQVFSHSTG